MDSSRVQTRHNIASQARRVDISLRAMSDCPLAPTTDPARYLIAARLRLPAGTLPHLMMYSSDHPLSPANPLAREILGTWSEEAGVEKAHTGSTATVRAPGFMSQSPNITSLDCAGDKDSSQSTGFGIAGRVSVSNGFSSRRQHPKISRRT
jgi:hypothetical protein